MIQVEQMKWAECMILLQFITSVSKVKGGYDFVSTFVCEHDHSKHYGLIFMNIVVNDYHDILLSAIVRAISRAHT